MEHRRSSSTFLSCNLLQFLIRWSLSKVKCLKQISLSERAREIATNERPAAYSLSPMSILVFGKVSPWLLWTVIDHARHIGSWSREHTVPDLLSQVRLIGTIGTTSIPSTVVMVGPSYRSNMIKTAVGSEGGSRSSNRMSCIVPIEPLTPGCSP